MRDDDFNFLNALMVERAGILLHPGRSHVAETHLAQIASEEGMESPEALIAEMRARPLVDLGRRIVERLLPVETEFFIGSLSAEALALSLMGEIIPKRAASRELIFWSAGCSSGQEAYSLAILLREHFALLPGWRIRILASDCSREALRRARQGLYSSLEVARGLPSSLLDKYFTRQGAWWQVCEELRASVEFYEINLIDSWPYLPTPDVVLLRNVVAFFPESTRRMTLLRVHHILSPDGYLLLGAQDPVESVRGHFEPAPPEGALLFRPARTRGA